MFLAKINTANFARLPPNNLPDSSHKMTDHTTPSSPDNPIQLITADIILLDDNQVFADAFTFRFAQKKIIHFADPREFLARCLNYAKDIHICIDHDFGTDIPINGLQVAETLHAQAFSKLYLVSGTYFSESELPSYLTFIEKINLEFFTVL